MKLIYTMLLCTLFYFYSPAQCAMCTKTAQQLGEKPAQGLNSGILYLMLAPFAIVGVIGYRWYKNNNAAQALQNDSTVADENIA